MTWIKTIPPAEADPAAGIEGRVPRPVRIEPDDDRCVLHGEARVERREHLGRRDTLGRQLERATRHRVGREPSRPCLGDACENPPRHIGGQRPLDRFGGGVPLRDQPGWTERRKYQQRNRLQ